MTLIEKLDLAKQCHYTLKEIAGAIGLNPDTLYSLRYKENYKLSEKNDKKLNEYLDSLDLSIDKIYTVYMHKNKINNKVYIGLTYTNPTRRWRQGEGYNHQPKFYNAIKKYGWDNFEHIIIKDHLTAEQASLLEKELIQQYDSLNPNKGYNNREGGIDNFTISEELRNIRSQTNKGKVFSLEHKQKIGAALKNRQFSEETRFKMSEAKLKAGTFQGSNNPKARKVKCIETQIVYGSIKEAAEQTNTSWDGISKCCRGLQKTAGKMHWEYYND